MRIGMNNVPQQRNFNEAAQVDKESKTLQKRVQRDKSMPPESTNAKRAELEVKMMMLQGGGAQAAQKILPAQMAKNAEKANKNIGVAQKYDRLELFSDRLNVRSMQKRPSLLSRQTPERTPDGRRQWFA